VHFIVMRPSGHSVSRVEGRGVGEQDFLGRIARQGEAKRVEGEGEGGAGGRLCKSKNNTIREKVWKREQRIGVLWVGGDMRWCMFFCSLELCVLFVGGCVYLGPRS
jgi:hypothetical protein